MAYDIVGQLKDSSIPFPLSFKDTMPKHKNRVLKKLHHYIIDDVEESPMDNIKAITLNCRRGNIRVVTSEEDVIRLHLHGRITTSNPFVTPSLLVNSNKSVLSGEIKDYHNSYEVVDSNLALDISIPANYQEVLSIKSHCGSLTIEAPNNINEINYESLGGSFKAKSLSCNKAVIKTITGNIRIEDLSSDVSLDTVTGSIDVNRLDAKKTLVIKSVVGDINIGDASLQGLPVLTTVTGKLIDKRSQLTDLTYNNIKVETVTSTLEIG
ncbi:DUF4097 domain-containing protein [Alkaliphilus pronyensis]|uniref:DUF4097 domain-containing protein n=1 Tax=Alkaliphilus pronyensis TaxID=1482732 RepID=A0A6I0FDH7_9FIRM|nr:DUF4097 family beta strand repeat-containing protein [Alkaliphilus pronyensis]KAB3540951.1 DUF4097 domain-containing protein [Alkaliphilus pronyensis]